MVSAEPRAAVMRLCLLLLLLTSFAAAQSAEQRTARYLDSVRKQPPLLLAFLRDLPKGGDLHNHLDGAIYAEDLIDFAASGNPLRGPHVLAPARPALRSPAKNTPPNPRRAAPMSITCSTTR
jgi:hypothetical protein